MKHIRMNKQSSELTSMHLCLTLLLLETDLAEINAKVRFRWRFIKNKLPCRKS